MSEYFLTKRETCKGCGGKGFNVVDADKGILSDCPTSHTKPDFHCRGYTETPVSFDVALLEALSRVRFTTCAAENQYIDRFDALRMEAE